MSKSKEFKPPNKPISSDNINVFLAGSIEMGNAVNWQSQLVKTIQFGADFLNPRRTDWDSSWKQDINEPRFFEQVSWELAELDAADIIFLYLDPETKSPVSLLELGLYVKSGKMIVCCPDGFYRKGNVDIVCQRFGIPVFTSLDVAIIALKLKIETLLLRF